MTTAIAGAVRAWRYVRAMNRNPYLCLAIVVCLGVVTIIGTSGIILLAIYNREPPAALVGITSAAGGALAGSLAATPLRYPEPPTKE